MLQTGNAKVINLDNRNSEKCNILFDSGAQRKYITKSLKDKLNLLPIRDERISIKLVLFLEQRILNTTN